MKHNKHEYFTSKLKEASNNPRKFWGIINELADRVNKKDSFPIDKFLANTQMSDTLHKQVANDFNSFFSSVGSSLADAIDSSGDPIVND